MKPTIRKGIDWKRVLLRVLIAILLILLAKFIQNWLIGRVYGATEQIGVAANKTPREVVLTQFPDISDVQKWKLYLYLKTHSEGLKYKDFVRLKEIAQCESGWRNFDSNGGVLSGLKHPADKGIFQINTDVHTLVQPADPYENIDYAVNLYLKEGAKPWQWSRTCWAGKIAV